MNFTWSGYILKINPVLQDKEKRGKMEIGDGLLEIYGFIEIGNKFDNKYFDVEMVDLKFISLVHK